MTTKTRLLLIPLFAFLSSAFVLSAASVISSADYYCTKPEGYVTIDVIQGSMTSLGVPIEAPALYRFEVATVANNTLTFADADF